MTPGRWFGPVPVAVDPGAAARYAAVTKDASPFYAGAAFVAPVYGSLLTWPVVDLVLADVLDEEATANLLHGEQDMHFRQPLVAGTTLATAAQRWSVRVGPGGTRLTVRTTADDAATGASVLEQYLTFVVPGWRGAEPGGPDKPDHTFRPDARTAPLGTVTLPVDPDQSRRYADLSGHRLAIHVDSDHTCRLGLPDLVLQGLCTMAMCGQAVVATVAGGHPRDLRRLAVRFSASVFVGTELTTGVYATASHSQTDERRRYGFEATSAGRTVITNGLAEFGPV